MGEGAITESPQSHAQREAPLILIGIYRASSEPGELGLLLPNLRIIDGRLGVAEAQLRDFLNAIERGANGSSKSPDSH